jgi:hypothetical protein
VANKREKLRVGLHQSGNGHLTCIKLFLPQLYVSHQHGTAIDYSKWDKIDADSETVVKSSHPQPPPQQPQPQETSQPPPHCLTPRREPPAK